MPGLKLVSVNIERSKHLDRVEAFLRAENPDIVCLQELCEQDIPLIESIVGGKCIYARVGKHPSDLAEQDSVMTGVGIVSKYPISEHMIEYYSGDAESAVGAPPRRTIPNCPLLMCALERAGVQYKIATTHFTWTPDGSTSDEQRHHLKALLQILRSLGEFVLAGDFNAPRIYQGMPGIIFAQLAALYTDNIPAHYTSSLDANLHRAGELDLMVDGLFTTPGYTASQVQLHTGVSDHCAISAAISR